MHRSGLQAPALLASDYVSAPFAQHFFFTLFMPVTFILNQFSACAQQLILNRLCREGVQHPHLLDMPSLVTVW